MADRNDTGGGYNHEGQDYGRDYGSGRDYTHSSARDYAAAGEFGGGQDRNFRGGGTGYGGGQQGGQGGQSYGQQGGGQGGQSYGQQGGGYGGQGGGYGGGQSGGYGSSQGGQSYGQQGGGYGGGQGWQPYGHGGSDYYGGRGGQGSGQQGGYGGQSYAQGGQSGQYRGSYGSDGHRFTDQSQQGWGGSDHSQQHGGNRQPERGGQDDRSFFQRAGDEVRSWFGDDDAGQRNQSSSGGSQRYGGGGDHDHYHNWRKSQIEALDRDYDEYRRESAKKFESEFGSWRQTRQTQRDSLNKVDEHMEVVGSDGGHVGTVDKVRGDRIILTKNDADAGGRHHSIPCSWIQSVDGKVTISKSADEAKKHWRDEERQGAFFGNDGGKQDTANATTGTSAATGSSGGTADDKDVNLNRSFSGTY